MTSGGGGRAPPGQAHQHVEPPDDLFEPLGAEIESVNAGRHEEPLVEELLAKGEIRVRPAATGFELGCTEDVCRVHGHASLATKSIWALFARMRSLFTMRVAPWASRSSRPSANSESSR